MMRYQISLARKIRFVLLALTAIVCSGVATPAAAACGGEGQRLCNVFDDGRGGCDRGLADVLGKCQRPGLCGGEGQRLCFVLIDGRGGCNAELVNNGQGICTHPNCGRVGQRACAEFGRNSCDAGLVEVNNSCFTRGDCGAQDQRACLIGERTGNSCNANLVERDGKCISTPNCGALGQPACAIVGRNSCNVGLVEVNNACFTRGDCGSLGNRACLIGERVGNSCDANLVERGGKCISTPTCGGLGELACAVVGRSSCDVGLVQVNHRCAKRGECGQQNQRACLVGERVGSSCDANLVEVDNMCFSRGNCGGVGQRPCLIGESRRLGCQVNLFEQNGVCITCGALGQRACAVVGRNSCDSGLVEVNDLCFTRADCGAADQRACLAGERGGNSCDPNLIEKDGFCYQCGAQGQRACAIVGRNSCDADLVEVNNMCFARAACGAVDQRACLIGERAGTSCDASLVEKDGVCRNPSGVATARNPASAFVFVRTDPPAPVFTPSLPVSVLATVHDATRGGAMVASRIDIFQSSYFGPGSVAPRIVSTCLRKNTCRAEVGVGSSRRRPQAISFKARVTIGREVFESPIRIADLAFAGAPVRMNVSAEPVGSGKIAQIANKRTIDLVFFAGTGYEFSSQAGATAFSNRLKDELETMLGVASGRINTLAENFAAVNFYVSLAPAVVRHIGLFGQCEHSTSGPLAWGDSQGILHPDLTCRDWSAPGPFYSAAHPAVSRHEMHHAAFKLSDEYCAGTIHFQKSWYPNVYNSKKDCELLSSDARTCTRIEDPPGCVDPNCACSTSYWRSDPGANDVMLNNTIEQADDRRAIRGKFDECRAGRC